MRVLSLLLALPSAAGLVGPELLSRLGPARGVVPAPSKRRAHVVVLAAARGAAPTIAPERNSPLLCVVEPGLNIHILVPSPGKVI